ncbi:DUF2235 domain-containing protein [Roseateles sp.]|uniref:T6SS phospholipase effector Tle1-like catalytic domain-containing protein n=1 Tax=Roseateles sp. TaxID=1971397 RepID=UPI002E01446C|nr:DUF2235 domain-containing protein [Roseateles sp.]
MATPPNTQGLSNTDGSSNTVEDSLHIVEVDKVQANLFFDGTLNNYFNVTTTDATVRDKHGGDDTSYDNALSNVARMWKPLGQERDGPDIGVYVEGMGTTGLQDDSLSGYAMGDGDTGIKQRAQSAFEPLQSIVARKRGKRGLPAILELNLFGFSRGAATARHFASLLRNPAEIKKHFTNDWSRVHVVVNFVGLFDTVSSEGLAYGNDVADLQLRFTDEAARRVFHLVALDEYRDHFSVTTIDSALHAKALVDGARVPMGFEMGIPGAHSDVGGGYKAGVLPSELGAPPPKATGPLEETERRNLPPTTSSGEGVVQPGPQAFVYAKGWYRPKDSKANFWHPYRHERTLKGDYFKVGLSLMVDMAERHTTTFYSSRLKTLITAKAQDIAQIQARLRDIAREKAFSPGQPTRLDFPLEALVSPKDAKDFRHDFLHLSLNLDKTGMGPRYKDDTQLERERVRG